MFAQFEAQAALGARFYDQNPHVARVYVKWLIRRRRDAEAARTARRKAREDRWRSIADGELGALSNAEADYYARREAFLSEATIEDEFRRDAIERRSPARVEVEPEPCVPLREAAVRLGVAEETMRQRVSRGAVRGFSVADARRVKGRLVVAVAEIERLEAEAVAA